MFVRASTSTIAVNVLCVGATIYHLITLQIRVVLLDTGIIFIVRVRGEAAIRNVVRLNVHPPFCVGPHDYIRHVRVVTQYINIICY